MKSTSWVALAALGLLGGFIVYSSLTTTVRCEVCIEFEGRTACRSVDGAVEEQALAAARTNACAHLASGVTKTMACERAPTVKSACAPR
jgi:hypothetical protein